MITTRNLQEILQSGLICKAGQIVSTPLFPQMEVFGFVPMKETDRYLDFNMRDTRIVANRVVVAPQEEKPDVFCGSSIKRIGVYPIYKVIESSVSTQKLPLRFLRIVEMEGNKYYDDYQRKGERAAYVKSPKVVMEKNEEDERPVLFYQLEKGEVVLKDAENQPVKCITPCFMVLCRRINTITGCLTYELYNPDDLVPLTAEPRI